MPIKFENGELVDFCMECDALVRDYFASTRAKEQMPALDFDWPRYMALEQQKKTLLVVARNGTELAGFVLYLLDRHLHHKTVLMAACDMLAVRPHLRGMGIGRMLMAHAEPLLQSRGVERIIHMFRNIYDDEAVPMFPRLGYEKIETAYYKVLAH